MKLFYYLLVTCSLLVMGTSCSEDGMLNSMNESENSSVKNVEVISSSTTKSQSCSGLMLKFKDEKTFRALIERLNKMTTKERIAFTDSVGFVSLMKLMKEADCELEVLVETAVDKADFETRYKIFKNKYSMFLFNEIDTTDLSPYFPLKDNLIANYVNENMSVMIGDKLIKNEIVHSYTEKMKNSSSIVTYAEEGGLNGTYAKVGKRKVCSHFSMTHNRFTVNFTCQKKNMFGWVRYSTIYNAKFLINNFVWVKIIPISGGTPEHLFETDTQNQEFLYTSKEEDGNYTFDLGYIKGGAPWSAKGRAKVWSRGVPEENGGTCVIDLISQQ